MASGQPSRTIRPPDTWSVPDPLYFREKPPCGYFALKNYQHPQHDIWLAGIKKSFHQLILYGERQPSNGLLYKVDPPDGETRFSVAYGDRPDKNLHILMEKIYAKHGKFTLWHRGRDSTGKHWIRVLSAVPPGSMDLPVDKALICVSSKHEQATVDSFRARAAAKKRIACAKAPRNLKEWRPKIPGAEAWAPQHLFLLPWRKQLPFLKPAAAKKLREIMEAKIVGGGL